ncbi:MAG: aspartate aminotransferase family protein [Ardenticatenia bacterium]|nr:MAG: aspartate aminotransferase family protein [Ardenticatenia bacterium]
MNAQDIIALEQTYLAPTYKRAPFVLERGEGVYLYDTEGRRYLDFVAGIAVNALGHADARMADVLVEQARQLVHVSNLYHTAPHALLARDLCEASFADRVFFCNSGTEATEGALKFARKWARTTSGDDEKYEIVTFSHAFHGRTMGALSVTANEKYRKPFEPLIGGVRRAEFNNLESAQAVIGEKTAAVIVEPVQGEGGIQPATREFLQGLRQLCDAYGAALIFDEVQCGLGRTGTLWAYEQYGVEPDLMALAKPLGGGLPIGAILMRQTIADALAPGDHGSTFAGSPLITAVARDVFNRIRDAAFLAHVRDVGAYLGEQLRAVAASSPLVREVRGLGLMWGVELDERVAAADVVAALWSHGLLTVPAGRNTVRFLPPLIVERTHVDEAVAAFATVLAHEVTA